MEETLNLYVDGELSIGLEADLFAHLSTCSACRMMFNGLMQFRRMVRQEAIQVAPAVDDAFFQRLDQAKRRLVFVDRRAERRPLWQSRPRISVRAATTGALLLFLAGVLFPQSAGERSGVVQGYVEGLEERVEFRPSIHDRSEAVYVFYPGLTVEATKLDDG